MKFRFVLLLILPFFFFLTQSFISSNYKNVRRQANNGVYPKGEFIFPINPGTTASLSGSYGDIRFNHFHSGLDIRTGGKEGVSVYSIGDGYVSRVGVSEGGYGNVLYITHPNGFTSVYGHLKEFAEPIKQALKYRQYAQQTWEIDTEFSPNEMQVKKGQIVAYSGNSGGSGGPHLHFEIRNEAEETIDPALFGFSEIIDNKKPVIQSITLKTIDANSRINGQFGELTFTPILLKNGNYILNNKISATGRIAIEVYTYDRSENTPFRLGITKAKLRLNEVEVYNFHLEKMNFATKLDMNTHTNYEKMVANGSKFHKLYVEEGNRLGLYNTNNQGGVITIENKQNDIKILIEDSQRNSTNLNFNIAKEEVRQVNANNGINQIYSAKIETQQFGNFLKIEAFGDVSSPHECILQNRGVFKSISPNYITNNAVVYIYDLKEGLVDFIQIGNTTKKLNLNGSITSYNPYFISENCNISFENAIYKDLFLSIDDKGNELVIDKDRFPLKNKIFVNWRPNQSFEQSKTNIYLKGNKNKFIGGEWQGNSIQFKAKELGTYILLSDTDAPVILPRTINSSVLLFTIKDNLSGINTIKCFVNNQWLMMEYEPKLNLIWTEKLDNSVPLVGKVVLEVTDNCNNKNTFQTNIN